MKSLSKTKYLVRDGITFNTVAPGGIMIDGTGWTAEQNKKGFAEMVDREFPLNRLGIPEEVAYIVTCLCSPKSSLINGACIPSDGGESSSF